MGSFHLWGYYNEHPVYQHYSGLDFLYFHKNQVCIPTCYTHFMKSEHFALLLGLGDWTKGRREEGWSVKLLSCTLPIRDDFTLAVWDEGARTGKAD